MVSFHEFQKTERILFFFSTFEFSHIKVLHFYKVQTETSVIFCSGSNLCRLHQQSMYGYWPTFNVATN